MRLVRIIVVFVCILRILRSTVIVRRIVSLRLRIMILGQRSTIVLIRDRIGLRIRF